VLQLRADGVLALRRPGLALVPLQDLLVREVDLARCGGRGGREPGIGGPPGAGAGCRAGALLLGMLGRGAWGREAPLGAPLRSPGGISAPFGTWVRTGDRKRGWTGRPGAGEGGNRPGEWFVRKGRESGPGRHR